jgi:hypothetical protein
LFQTLQRLKVSLIFGLAATNRSSSMVRILKLTFALTLLFCLFAFIAGIIENGIGVGLYYAILGFGSMFFPIMSFVVIYHLLFSKRLNYPNMWFRFFAKSIFLILISFIGLFVWTILEFIVTSGFNIDFGWIAEDYRDEYLSYMPAVIILAALIPIGHHLFRPQSSKSES